MNETIKETLEEMIAALDDHRPDDYFDAFERLLKIHREALKK